jgi:hypothetical protein
MESMDEKVLAKKKEHCRKIVPDFDSLSEEIQEIMLDLIGGSDE